MLLNLICAFSALVALGICAAAGGFSTLAWLWLLPLGFVGCFLLGLVACLVLLLITEKHTDSEGDFETDDPYIRGIIRWYAPAVFRLLGCKIEATGTEKLPADGRFLLVSNHLADLDPGIFFTVFPNDQLSFIAKKEVRDMPIVGVLMRRILCQFVNRENDREALKTILKCISILKENKANVAVFPEGKKSTDRYLLHHFRPGVFKMAQKADVPIVVCTLRGTQNILPNARKLRCTDVRLNLVEVIPAPELKGVTTVDIAQRVHRLMAADLGAENVAED